MLTILGMEGPWDKATPISWGAAVVMEDNRIFNSLSSLWVSLEHMEKEVTSQTCLLFSKPHILSDEKHPFIILGFQNQYLPFFPSESFVPPSHIVLEVNASFYIFPNQSLFSQYCENILPLFLEEIQRLCESDKAKAFQLATTLLVLYSKEPRIHALRILTSPDRIKDRVQAFAKSSTGCDLVFTHPLLTTPFQKESLKP